MTFFLFFFFFFLFYAYYSILISNALSSASGKTGFQSINHKIDAAGGGP